MGSEKFFVFNEAGTLKRLKGRIVRFLDNEEPDNDDKVAIRSSLSVPASAEGLTPANNLSDVSNAATSRANLSVNSIPEDAEANGTKLLGPSVYFDGTNDYVEVADDSRFTFSDGNNDLPFTLSAWVKSDDWTTCPIVSKWGTSAAAREWMLLGDGSDYLALRVYDTSGNYEELRTSAALTSYEGQYIHVAACYGGAGPNSDSAFTAASDAITLYINGVAVATTPDASGVYTGMSNTTQPLWIGRYGSNYTEGHIRNAQIFNRELTASEVADLAKGNELGFADQYAGAFAGLGAIDETSGLISWTGVGSIVPTNLTETANTTVGGRANVLKQEATTSTTGNTRFYITSTATAGTRVRVEFDYYIPSTNTTVDRIGVLFTGGSTLFQATTLDAWTRASVEAIVYSGSNTLQVLLWDGGTNNSTIGDYIGLDNFSITQIGTLADFRSERFDSSTNKWYDLSDNAFIGTNSGATLVGREVPVYETGTWTGSIEFGGASAGQTYSANNCNYTRTGNVVHVQGILSLTAKGSSQGTARIAGLPFASSSDSSQAGLSVNYGTGFASLTSSPSALVSGSSTTALLSNWGASGITTLSHANFTDNTSIRFSGSYKIS